MNKKTSAFALFVIFVLVLGIYATLRFSVSQIVSPSEEQGNNVTVCTMEAKLCPDGSSVGRTGPRCEFAKCPEVVSVTSGLGKTIVQKGLKITPLKIVEDSRCPAGVMCIQAGRLVVKTKFERVDGVGGTKEIDIELGKSVEVLEMSVSFDSASLVKDKNYNFTFVVTSLTR